MKGNTIELYKNGRLYQTFFNSLVNTDNLNEGIFTIYVGHNEWEYIYTMDEWSYKIIR